MNARIEADYLIETATDPARAVEEMAGEQSSGTFIAIPGETGELMERSRARVERVETFGQTDRPSLPGGAPGDSHVQANVTLSWPLDNIGADLPNLVATVAGNLFELRPFSGLRLLDIRLPQAFAARYAGPKFGVAGTRALTGVAEGPVIGTIVKPSVGLGADETADLAGVLARAGIDFIKDDELQADGPRCPFDDRVRAVMAVLRAHREATGKAVMFAFNLTGEVDEMKRRHDLVLAEGGSAVMASLNSVGLAGMIELGRHSQLPIHAHRNGWGAISRAPMLGWSYVAWSKLWRLAGADHMHVNGLANKFCEGDDSVIASARSLLAPLWPDRPAIAMPVFSSGQTIRQVADTWARLGSADLIHAAGGGILGHPDGPAAGVESFRAAWDAAQSGVSLADRARDTPSLARAMQVFAG